MKIKETYLKDLAETVHKTLIAPPEFGTITLELKYQDATLVNFRINEETSFKPKSKNKR